MQIPADKREFNYRSSNYDLRRTKEGKREKNDTLVGKVFGVNRAVLTALKDVSRKRGRELEKKES